jgi:hypothetical protein
MPPGQFRCEISPEFFNHGGHGGHGELR